MNTRGPGLARCFLARWYFSARIHFDWTRARKQRSSFVSSVLLGVVCTTKGLDWMQKTRSTCCVIVQRFWANMGVVSERGVRVTIAGGSLEHPRAIDCVLHSHFDTCSSS